MVGHKIEHQPDAAPGQPGAEPGQRRIAAEAGADGVFGDRKAGAADILVDKVGQGLDQFRPQIRIGAIEFASGRSGLPYAQQPDPVEPRLCEAVEDRIVDLGERDASSGGARQTLEPDAGVDLQQSGVTHSGRHDVLLTIP